MDPSQRGPLPMDVPHPRLRPSAEDLLEHLGFVQSLARVLVSDQDVADDVAQETLLAAIERPPAPQHGLRAWLRGVVWRRIQLHYRAEGRRERHEGLAGRDLQSAEEQKEHVAGEALLRAEQSRLLIQALIEMPERYRSVILLRYMDGLPPGQIAERLVMPVATVHTRLQRGLAALRRRLDRESGGDRTAWTAAFAVLARPRAKPGKAGSMVKQLTLAASLIAALPVTWFLLEDRAPEAPRLSGSTPARNAERVLASEHAHPSSGEAVLIAPEEVPGGERSAVTVEDGMLSQDRTATVRAFDARTGLALAGVRFLPAETVDRAGDDVGDRGPAAVFPFRFFREDPDLARTRTPTAEAWVTDAHGTARVELPVGGAARVDAVLPGYVPARGVVLSADPAPPTVVALERAAALRLVRGEERAGDILRVKLYSRARRLSSGWLTMDASASELVLDSLPPDRYEIAAVAHGAQPPEDPSLLGDFGIFNGVDRSLGGRVRWREALLVAGTEISLTLFANDGVEVHVRLVGASPIPAGVCVLLHTMASPALPAAVAVPTAEGGRFASVPPGTYELTVIRDGHTFLRSRVTVPDQDAPLSLELPLWSGALEVSVKTSTDPLLPPPALILHGPVDHEAVPAVSKERYAANTRFDSLAPGRYELWILDHQIRRREVVIGAGLETLRIEREPEPPSVTVRGPQRLDRGAVEPYLFSESGLWIAGDEDGDGKLGGTVGRCFVVVLGAESELWFEEVDLSEDLTLDVHRSELVEVEIHLTYLGRPIASTPVAIAPVEIAPAEDWFVTSLVTSPDGVLSLHISPGRYRLWTPNGLQAELNIPVGGGLRLVDLRSP